MTVLRPSKFPVRRVQPADAAPIFALLEASKAAALQPIGPEWSFRQIESECGESGLVSFDPEIQAFLLWRDNGTAWEISFLATDPRAQGRGVMSSLINEMKRLKPADRAIWLEVHAENLAARHLYEKAGFVKTGERARYYSDGGSAILYNYG